MDDIKQRSVASCKLWKLAGKPRSGYTTFIEKIKQLIRVAFVRNSVSRKRFTLTIFTRPF